MLVVGFELDGVKRTLDLRLNSDLIPVGYQQRHQHQGTYKVYTPSKVVSNNLFFNLLRRDLDRYIHQNHSKISFANNIC